jgi:diguanylate cyclase (GGDEF)-like protein
LIVDIDHFKRINDNYGHQFGDNVLCRVAEAIQQSTRRSDLKCRLGGEEFLVLCPGLKGDEVLQLAERIRAAIAEIAIPGISLHGSVTCTATIGVSNPFITSQAFDITLQQADALFIEARAPGATAFSVRTPNTFCLRRESKARRSSLSNRERA